ncbi:MAG: AAA family ATPase [Myxococcaceae bacterium]
MTAEAGAVDALLSRAHALEGQIQRRILGQPTVVRELLVTLLAGGHALVRGVPGLAKTLLARSLAEATHLSFKRVQFTPDLLPSDITGSEVLDEVDGRRALRFLPGPVFVHLLLADEINRTAPKTQAALLEAMAEHQVTVGGTSYRLPEPFCVVATQNPIEQEGTYPLPEAQLDRFLLCIRVEYPAEQDEVRVLLSTTGAPSGKLEPVLQAEELLQLQALVREVAVAESLVKAVARLVRSSRPGTPGAAAASAPLAWGASPRGGQALLLAAKARALLEGRFAASAVDVRALALPVLRHRLVLSWTAAGEGVDADGVVQGLLDACGL